MIGRLLCRIGLHAGKRHGPYWIGGPRLLATETCRRCKVSRLNFWDSRERDGRLRRSSRRACDDGP